MTDDLPFDYPSPATVNVTTRRCRRHDWALVVWSDGGNFEACRRCGLVRDLALAKQNKNNRARGNTIERDICRRLGVRHTGQFGGPDDGASDLWAVQVKSGGSFSERYWAWLRAVPVVAGQVPLLVVTDAPGPGRRRRAIVVLDMDSWLELHGPTEVEP